jgi:8-oxo-dGTP pyrophosphatase MutT (NUDIX family)
MRKRQEWFSATIIHRGTGSSTQFLIIKQNPFDPQYPEKAGFPGGMRSRKDQSYLRTAERETRDETGLKLKRGITPEAIFTIVDHGQKKVFFRYCFSDFEGELRKEMRDDGDAVLLPPRWATLEELLRCRVLARAHRLALLDTAENMGLVK